MKSRNIMLLAALALDATAAVVENDSLSVGLNETNGALTVVDKRTSRVWTSLSDGCPLVLTRAEAGNGVISFEASTRSVAGTLSGRVTLEGESVRCRLEAPPDAPFAVGDENLVG